MKYKYEKVICSSLKAISAMVLLPKRSSGGLKVAADFITLQSLIDSRWIPMFCDIILEIPSEVVYRRMCIL